MKTTAEKVQEKLATAGATQKIAEFRQSSWTQVATGTNYIYYNGALPPQDGTFTKNWDQNVFQVTVCTPVE
jgi:hypothetical protein